MHWEGHVLTGLQGCSNTCGQGVPCEAGTGDVTCCQAKQCVLLPERMDSLLLASGYAFADKNHVA